MTTTKELIDEILHYKRSIERNQNDEERLLHCVKKLYYLPINVKILQETGIDKTVNSIRKFGGNFDETVNALVLKWKEMLPADVKLAKFNFEHQDENEYNNFLSSGKQATTHKGHNNGSDQSFKEIQNQCIEGIEPEGSSDKDKNEQGNDRKLKKKSRCKCCNSNKRKGNSSKYTKDHSETNKRQRIGHDKDKFEDSLQLKTIESDDSKSNMVGFATAKESKSSITSTITSNSSRDSEKDDSNVFTLNLLSSKAKIKPLNFNIVTHLSTTIVTNYNAKALMKNNRPSSDNPSFDESKVFLDGISSKTKRTKVYAGVKNSKITQPASLFDNCKAVLQKYIAELKYTNNVPFSILKPILERATPEQLLKLEDYNPYLLEDSGLLWHLHVKRYFCTQRRREMETWREMFLRCQEEKNCYLSKLTEKYNQKKINETPGRKIQLANDDSKFRPPGVRQRIQHNNTKAKSDAPITGDDQLSGMETLTNTKNDVNGLMNKPSGKTKQRKNNNGDKAKLVATSAAPVATSAAPVATPDVPVVTPAVPVAGVGSDTIKETKPGDARLRVIEALKNSTEVRSATKRAKKAPLMEKTLKYIRTLRKQ